MRELGAWQEAVAGPIRLDPHCESNDRGVDAAEWWTGMTCIKKPLATSKTDRASPCVNARGGESGSRVCRAWHGEGTLGRF
jgi:hypothetical protein